MLFKTLRRINVIRNENGKIEVAEWFQGALRQASKRNKRDHRRIFGNLLDDERDTISDEGWKFASFFYPRRLKCIRCLAKRGSDFQQVGQQQCGKCGRKIWYVFSLELAFACEANTGFCGDNKIILQSVGIVREKLLQCLDFGAPPLVRQTQ